MDWVDVAASLDDIISGKLRDTDRIREVLSEASRMYQYEFMRQARFNTKLILAQQAFLHGWPESAPL